MKEFKLILITGEPGSGKTTLSRYFSNAGFPVVHTSAIFKMALLKKLIVPPQDGNKFAPAEADDFIISAIRKMLMKAILEGQSQLVVETFPRTIDQFNKIGELIPNYLKEKGISVTPILVFLTAAEETRIERMQNRTADRKKFDADRGYNDAANNEMFSYVSELSFERKLEEKTADYDKSLYGMKFTVYDSTVNDPSLIVSALKKLLNSPTFSTSSSACLTDSESLRTASSMPSRRRLKLIKQGFTSELRPKTSIKLPAAIC